MKKFLICLVTLVSLSCMSSAPRTPYTNSRGDGDAAYAQSLMNKAVKIQETITVEATAKLADMAPVQYDLHSSGSGVIVNVDKVKGTSSILTAWHVCDHYEVGYSIEDSLFDYKVVKDHQQVISVEEDKYDLRIIFLDKATDTCVIEVDHVFPSYAKLATSMPPRGGMVDVVGAPEGNWGKYLVSMQSGRYFGLTDIEVTLGTDDEDPTSLPNYAYYGFGGVGGYSGSGVFYRGRLIGLFTAGSTRYEHACYGPALHDIRKALKAAGVIN